MRISPINVNYNRNTVQKRVSKLPATQQVSTAVSFKANPELSRIQQEALEAQKKAIETTKEQFANYQKLMQEMQNLQSQKETKVQKFIEKIKLARIEGNWQIADIYEELKELTEKMYEPQIKEKEVKLQETCKLPLLYQKLHEVNDNKGFGRIAGYQNEKDYLVDLVGNSIITEQSGNPAEVINGILFYGPKGNGKTTFAKAFAEQLGCRLVKVNNYIDPSENVKNLMKLVNEAKKNFEKDNIRTILYLDKINCFAPKDSPIVDFLKSLLDDLSEEYHCTLFATTNHPEKLDNVLLSDGRFGIKMPLEPANLLNAEAILKHYGQQYADDNVDFLALAAHIIKDQPNKAYSNARIRSVVENFVRKTKITKMSQQDFLQAIKDTPADITREALELFKQQKKYMKHI